MRLQGADGQDIAGLNVEFGIGDTSALEPGESVSVPMPLPLPEAVVLPEPGAYSFELLIDGIHQASVPFIATKVEPPPEGGQ